MATTKSYTDLEQSKKLATILPIETADMYYDDIVDNITGELFTPSDGSSIRVGKGLGGSIAAWSLAALLNVLPYPSLHKTFSGWRCDSYNEEGTSHILGESSDNPVDACVKMIIKLSECKML